MAEWLKATDCKSVLFRVRRFESAPAHHCGNSSVGRALASQAKCREFESRFPLQVLRPVGQCLRLCSSVVEHSLGKGEVVSSILTTSSNVRNMARFCSGPCFYVLAVRKGIRSFGTARLILYGLLFLGEVRVTPQHPRGGGNPLMGNWRNQSWRKERLREPSRT